MKERFVWLEATTNPPAARMRLRELSAQNSGEYLIFDHVSLQIIETLCDRNALESIRQMA
jgi:hypothetical protein